MKTWFEIRGSSRFMLDTSANECTRRIIFILCLLPLLIWWWKSSWGKKAKYKKEAIATAAFGITLLFPLIRIIMFFPQFLEKTTTTSFGIINYMFQSNLKFLLKPMPYSYSSSFNERWKFILLILILNYIKVRALRSIKIIIS